MTDNHSIIRQLKIDMITGEPNVYTDWFNSVWGSIHHMEIYTQLGRAIVYYIDDGILVKNPIFFTDPIFNNWYFDYKFFYTNLRSLGFDYDTVGKLINMVELLLSSKPNITISVIAYGNLNEFTGVKEALS